jgi:lysophospholipase L1-like esterase
MAGASGAATWAAGQATLDQAVSDGLRVVVGYELPCGNYGGCSTKNADILAYNSAAQTWCNANSASATCVDLYTQFATGTALNATYDSGDGLHPNDTGSTLLGTLLAGANP